MSVSQQGEPAVRVHLHNAPGLLLAFVVFSVLLHGITLLFVSGPVLTPPAQPFGSRVISTVLIPAEKAVVNTRTATPPPVRDPAERVAKQSAPSPLVTSNTGPTRPATRTAAADATAPQTLSPNPTSAKPMLSAAPSVTTPTPATNESLAQQQQIQRNYLLGELQNRLSRYLSYPPRARRRGWQGEVRVAFHVDRQGQLNNIRLAKSSGYSLLDRSAVNAIKQLGHITLPHRLGSLQPMDLLLPVSYQLREG